MIPEILFITSYPPRECGIATYSQDLLHAIREQFGSSFDLKVCAIETKENTYTYPEEVKYVLQVWDLEQYHLLAEKINADANLKLVFIQHEFGLYDGEYGQYLLRFLSEVSKPVVTTFHTILPNPSTIRKNVVKAIVLLSEAAVVMTRNSALILEADYQIPVDKISIIPHGTHLVSPVDLQEVKKKMNLSDRRVLATFGLLSSGKSIETALDALPEIVAAFPEVLYLIIGKTHPGILKTEGEKYREFLFDKVIDLHLENHVRFINKYLPLDELLEYLQSTDIYLFTSKDPHQAVSGTFAYAMACGCPIISTPIPHAKELLDGAGIIVDFQNAPQLAKTTIKLLSQPALLQEMRLKALHRISPTAWQNAALAHVELAVKFGIRSGNTLTYELPDISLAHIRRLTTHTAMIQFSSISTPDLESGYTLDDNARALIAITKHYQLTADPADLELIDTYLSFIIFCQQADGSFLNYVDQNERFFDKNRDENLEDSNGRAIWALGEFVSMHHLFDNDFSVRAGNALDKSLSQLTRLHSPRAMAFVIKGLHHYNQVKPSATHLQLITALADDLVSKYRGVSDEGWQWFEEYLTYANSLLPEALLYAYLSTGSALFKNTAKSAFDFLLSVIFKDGEIKVVSNQGWHLKGKSSKKFGEQPIDVAYTILALSVFYETFKEEDYLIKMATAFDWFLGKNHLHQIVYNPRTGGCYDGLEEYHTNLNQGAESTVSYLLARLTVEQYFNKNWKPEAVEAWVSDEFELITSDTAANQ